MDSILEWCRSTWQGGVLAAVEAITPLWWMIVAVAGFGLGFLTSGRVEFGSTLAAGCLVAGVADLCGASAWLQLALVPVTSMVLVGAFAWRLWSRSPASGAAGALVPGEVVGCSGVVVSVDETDPRRLRVRLDGRHEWPASCVDGTRFVPGDRIRVRSRERNLLLVETEPRTRK